MYKTIGRAEDFTDAFLITLGIILFMSFWVIAAAYGYIWMITVAISLNQFFNWIGRSRPD